MNSSRFESKILAAVDFASSRLHNKQVQVEFLNETRNVHVFVSLLIALLLKSLDDLSSFVLFFPLHSSHVKTNNLILFVIQAVIL